MSGNIPGAPNALPGVYDVVETLSSGTAVPGGIRIAAIIGQGSKSETIISSALGGGQDGLNPTYTGTTGADGRHFALSTFPIVSNRTALFRNGIPLVGLEDTIDTNPFSNLYDYRIDISNGHIELQNAYLVDQGGAFYKPSGLNVGDGYIGSLTLLDIDAPQENWTVKCISVQRNGSNLPINGTAKFIASGSVSGNVVDSNGNQVIWIANGQLVTNGILQFYIAETIGGASFREGDSFTIQVKSGMLNKNDSLTATYIPTANLNAPILLQSTQDVTRNFGTASVSNNLSLGCQLAFANGAPAVMCVQAAPEIPRRISYELDPDGINASSTNQQDFIFPLPVGVTPDFNSDIHFFVTNLTTNVETQLLPNKFPFYTLGTSGQPTINQFIFDNTNPPGGNSFSYSVIEQNITDVSGFDGYITVNPGFPLQCVFGSPSQTFTSIYETGNFVIQVLDAKNVANNAYFLVTNVVDGYLYGELSTSAGTPLSHFTDFTNETDAFQVINPATGLPVASGSGVDGVIVASVSTGTATLTSGTVNFTSIPSILNMKLKINGSATNNGLYNITSNPSSGQIVIQKTVTLESNLRYEIIDTTNVGQYVVINHNVVPNGNALRVTVVNEKDASFFDAGWINALASLEPQEIDILVALPQATISVIFQNAYNHCLTMSSVANRKERVFFTGAINGLTPANLTGAQLAAVEQLGQIEGIPQNDISTLLAGQLEDIANYSVPDAFGSSIASYRAVYFYPDQIIVSINGSNTLIDGFYIAAAAAGYLSGITNVAIPLTNKVLSGFTILNNKQFSPLVLAQLVQAGVTTLQPVQGGGKVIWGITTSQSGFIEEQEISIVFIRDRIAKALRGGFDGFIGLPEDNNTTETLSARANGLLLGFIAAGLITAYKDLSVQRDSVDPTQWDITVRVQPVYPVNFIFIKVNIGLL